VAAELLAGRAWTAAQLVTRLRRRGAPPDVAAQVVEQLTARGYVDDAEFARRWVESRAARGYGVARLANELRARGVAPALIEAALGGVAADPVASARAVAARRLAALRRAAPDRVALRLRDYLLRRGYDPRVAVHVARDLAGGDAPGARPRA
jgi:regulatory protein